jgi:hypothetical protein
MTLKKIVDGVEVECSAEEIAEFETYQSNSKSAEEIALISLRAERDGLLLKTDWWAVSDRTLSQEQLEYRQALRDITDHYSSLDEVVWPEKPESN